MFDRTLKSVSLQLFLRYQLGLAWEVFESVYSVLALQSKDQNQSNDFDLPILPKVQQGIFIASLYQHTVDEKTARIWKTSRMFDLPSLVCMFQKRYLFQNDESKECKECIAYWGKYCSNSELLLQRDRDLPAILTERNSCYNRNSMVRVLSWYQNGRLLRGNNLFPKIFNIFNIGDWGINLLDSSLHKAEHENSLIQIHVDGTKLTSFIPASECFDYYISQGLSD